MSRVVDPNAERLAALSAAARRYLAPGDPLRVEIHASAHLAGVPIVGAPDRIPAPAEWIAAWDACAREIERELAHVAGTASYADADVARARERRWSHHSTVVRALLEQHARGER